jgi:hypothetical protein
MMGHSSHLQAAVDDFLAHNLHKLFVFKELAHDMRVDQFEAAEFVVSVIRRIGRDSALVEPLEVCFEFVWVDVDDNDTPGDQRRDPLCTTCGTSIVGIAPLSQTISM